MTNQDQSTHSPATTTAGPDLCLSINQRLERLPGEEVRSVRVFGDVYRCNWWTQSRTDWLGTASSRISRSKLLRVVLNGDKLAIDEVGGG
jgi:hypothetical protein